jgi:tetratricopeptide (TPR) repeat protein
MRDQLLCFVLMPFGKKPDPAGGADVDFDRIYEAGLQPGIEDAGMLPIRADEEKLGGIIHQAMYERLLLCDFALADLTTGNPNVLYELGIRHAARPRTTLTVYAAQKPLPFDVALLRTQRYELGEGNSFPDANADALRQGVREHLGELKQLAQGQSVTDSPLFQLVRGWDPKPLGLEAAESFLEQLKAHEQVKQRLNDVRAASNDKARRPEAAASLVQIRKEVLDSGTTDVGVLTSLMLGYRALEDWSGMIEVYGQLPEFLQRQYVVRQLLAFAYNRRAERDKNLVDRERALQLLRELQQEQGATSETCGLIGRIYKSEWTEAQADGKLTKARGYLKQAIAAYVGGFESDWRDVYPGINAVTLLDVQGGRTSLELKDRLLPVVRFAVEQRLRAPTADYWDHATLLEIAVLENDAEQALDVLDTALTAFTETWQPKTTADNLRIIERARTERGEDIGWLSQLIHELDAAAGEPAPPATQALPGSPRMSG